MERQVEMRAFRKEFLAIAVPVTLQSLLQSSFSVVDQIMTGQLGEVSIAGIGLAGRFVSLYTVLLAAVAAVAGILLAQYIGRGDDRETGRSFYLNLCIALVLAAVFAAVCLLFPQRIMGLYTPDLQTRDTAASYLRVVAAGFVPLAVSSLLSTLFRCKELPAIPLYAAFFNAGLNTLLNYALIFGHFGLPRLGVAGAALATVISQYVGAAVLLVLFFVESKKRAWTLPFALWLSREGWRRFGGILAPILVCEFFWSLGENVYGVIYGHIGTDACAAMTLTTPMQTLFIGAMGGVSQAAGILIGKRLGAGEYDAAYGESKRMMGYGAVGSLCLSVLLILLGSFYVDIFQVAPAVRQVGYQLLVVFAILAPVKVANMILGGGIIRSGGRTKYVMAIDLIGTWCFGVPLGLLTAFVLELPITAVYFILSLEECVRLGLSVWVFRRKKWMSQIESG